MSDTDKNEDQATEAAGEKLSIEERLGRLEQILARLETDEVPLDEALDLFEEGVGHVRDAERVLAETELRVEELLAGGGVQDMDIEDA